MNVKVENPSTTENKNGVKNADEEPEQSSEISFIQLLFDSQIGKRQQEEKENQMQKTAGLKGFKATDNPIADAFKRRLELEM